MQYLCCFILLFSASVAMGQSTSTHTDRTTYTNSKNNKVESESSISHSATTYKLTAQLTASKRERAIALLVETLGDQYQREVNNSRVWRQKVNGNNSLFCHFEAGNLLLSMDKTLAPVALQEEIEALGERIIALVAQHVSSYGGGSQYYDPQLTGQSAKQRKLELALQELEQARKKVEAARKALKQ